MKKQEQSLPDSSKIQTFGEFLDSMTPEQLSRWWDGWDSDYEMTEDFRIVPKTRQTPSNVEEMMERIRTEHPDFLRSAEQLKDDPERLQGFLSVLDSYD